jgi:hypothetical protein
MTVDRIGARQLVTEEAHISIVGLYASCPSFQLTVQSDNFASAGIGQSV